MRMAPVVFVGTATEVTNRDRTATFDVDEIWERVGDVPETGGDDRFVTELPTPWIVAGVTVLALSVVAAYAASRRH